MWSEAITSSPERRVAIPTASPARGGMHLAKTLNWEDWGHGIAPYVELVYESVHGAIPDGVKFRFRDVISDDDMDDLGHLLRAPADPNHGLEWAAFYAHDEAMGLLLDAAADPNYARPLTLRSLRLRSTSRSRRATTTTPTSDKPPWLNSCVWPARMWTQWTAKETRPSQSPPAAATVTHSASLCAAQANLDTAAPQGDENCGNTALQKAAHEEMASATP